MVFRGGRRLLSCAKEALSVWGSGSSCPDLGQQKFGGTHGKGFACCFHAEDKFLDDLFPLPFGETTEGDLPGFTVFTADQEDGQSIGNIFGSAWLCSLTFQADDIFISDPYRILIDAQSARKIAFDGKVGLGEGDRLRNIPTRWTAAAAIRPIEIKTEIKIPRREFWSIVSPRKTKTSR